VILFGARAGEVRDLDCVDDAARIEGIDPLLDDTLGDLRGFIVAYLDFGAVRVWAAKPASG
jgi:hypothetical protein